MIISASRRTDIPACYCDWFFNRLREAYVLVRNPMNFHQIARIDLSPEVVDGIVFWTKNPLPMMNRLSELANYNYYFQFTLTAYDKDIEPDIPCKNNLIIPAFRKLSQSIGREKVVWRYDPIFFNDKYTMEYHCRYFKIMAAKLGDFTEKCTVSFLDLYQKTARNMQSLKLLPVTKEQQLEMLRRFAEIGKEYGFSVDTCCEAIELDGLGISHAHCIDKQRLEQIGKCKLAVQKDPNQRPACGCIASIDIGAYDTCINGCRYCYANNSQTAVTGNSQLHNPKAPLLFGEAGTEDVIKERKVKSWKECQMTLFDLLEQFPATGKQ